jgi:hypothetical protein
VSENADLYLEFLHRGGAGLKNVSRGFGADGGKPKSLRWLQKIFRKQAIYFFLMFIFSESKSNRSS